MAGVENLKPLNERTKEEQREIAKKGGISSGKSRRQMADMRKAAQAILSGTYKDEENNDITGAERVVLNMFEKAVDKEDKQSVQAARFLLELAGQDKTTEDKKRIKLMIKQMEKDIELTQKKIENAEEW